MQRKFLFEDRNRGGKELRRKTKPCDPLGIPAMELPLTGDLWSRLCYDFMISIKGVSGLCSV